MSRSMIRTLFPLLLMLLGSPALAQEESATSETEEAPLRPPRWADRDFSRYNWNGFRLAYTIDGEGEYKPPVLLLHGLNPGESSAIWSELIEDLAEEHIVYTVDFYGFGDSDRSDRYENMDPRRLVDQLRSFIQDVIIARTGERPIVVAPGEAGTAALFAASRYQVMRGLVLMSPVGLRRSDRAPLERVGLRGAWAAGAEPSRSHLRRQEDMGSVDSRQRFLRRAFHNENLATDELSRAWAWYASQPGSMYSNIPAASGWWNLNARTQVVGTLELPVYLIWGIRDRVHPHSQLDDWLELRQDLVGRTRSLDGGYLLPLELPGILLRTLTEQFDGILEADPILLPCPEEEIDEDKEDEEDEEPFKRPDEDLPPPTAEPDCIELPSPPQEPEE